MVRTDEPLMLIIWVLEWRVGNEMSSDDYLMRFSEIQQVKPFDLNV